MMAGLVSRVFRGGKKMATRIVIDPVTRIEGHLMIEAMLDAGQVKEVKSSGTLFRGFEIFLEGREPRDAQRITQRVCGVCPTSHSIASTLNLDSAFGIADKIPDNGRIMRNIVLACNFLQSHILHFYHLAALDYVDVTAVANYTGEDWDVQAVKEFIGRGQLGPFVPRYEGDYRFDQATNQELTRHYLKALEARKLAQEALAIFGGKMPHNATVCPGGITEHPTVDKIANILWRVNRIREFIDTMYVPDILAAARVYPDYFEIGNASANFLSYGVFDLDGKNPDYSTRKRLLAQGALEGMKTLHPLDTSKITESIKHSWYKGDWTRPPREEVTEPDRDKQEGYSWLKSPRYDDKVYEVGPLARLAVSYFAGVEPVKKMIDDVLSQLGAKPAALNSTLGRHAARALETKLVADAMPGWLLELKPGEPVCAEYEVPEQAEGLGIVGAPRGALLHHIQIMDKKIAKYQLVVPTTWNGSPKDDRDRPGPIEQAILGTKIKDPGNPYEIVRIVRSFDPCLACAIHTINHRGSKLGEFKVV
jgi:hydrogenase large subunit